MQFPRQNANTFLSTHFSLDFFPLFKKKACFQKGAVRLARRTLHTTLYTPCRNPFWVCVCVCASAFEKKQQRYRIMHFNANFPVWHQALTPPHPPSCFGGGSWKIECHFMPDWIYLWLKRNVRRREIIWEKTLLPPSLPWRKKLILNSSNDPRAVSGIILSQRVRWNFCEYLCVGCTSVHVQD